MLYLRPTKRSFQLSALIAITSVGMVAQEVDTKPLIQPGTLPEKSAAPTVQESEMPLFPLATPVEAQPNAAPLDFHGKLDWYIKSVSGVQSLGRVALTTGFRSVTGGGDGSYVEDFGTRYAEHVTRRSVQFAIATMRGEDPRFRRSGQEGFWDRTKFVLSRTVLTDMDNGGTSIAVGKLTGSFAGNTLSSYMRNQRDPMKDALIDTGTSLGGDFGYRMIREFWPDIRKMFGK